MKTLALGLVASYRIAISPAWPSACKFYPSCSAYATEAIEKHGVGKGIWLTAQRFLRCRPLHAGGIDLVP